jgi:hypothetical protein
MERSSRTEVVSPRSRVATGVGVRVPVAARFFSPFLFVQTGSVALPVSYLVGTLG